MTLIDILIIGMWSIVTDQEISCSASAATQVNNIALVSVDPGFPHAHKPVLWVRLDSIVDVGGMNPVPDCYNQRRVGPTTCDASLPTPEVWWAKFELRGLELKVDQRADLRGSLKTGQRRPSATPGPRMCWAGSTANASACRGDIATCKLDASWIPEYSKPNIDGQVDANVVYNPQNFKMISAISRGLKGDLQSADSEDLLTWKWKWNHENECSGINAPDYEQQFNRKARLADVQSQVASIELAQISDGSTVTTINVTTAKDLGDPRDPSKFRVWTALENKPLAAATIMEVAPDMCVIPHFESHYGLLLNKPRCRKVPYFTKTLATCDDHLLGDDDPVCPPVILKGP